MNDQSDSQLLRAYAEDRSEPAFTMLVRRHVDLVYSAALRMVCDSHLAEDVTQAVFVALARSTAKLKDRAALSGWLHRTAQNIAAQTVRTDVRRRAREQESSAMNELHGAEPDASWEQIAPHLDAALGELSEPDRDALLFRYFERKSAREMAETFGISADAAQKRVNRAVDRLREGFAKRGIKAGASGIPVILLANAVQTAPAGLTSAIATAAALTGSTLATSATVTATNTITMTTLQKAIVTATATVLAGTGIYEARQASQLREQIQSVEREQAPLQERMQLLERERMEATNRLAALREDNERLNRTAEEVLRLRGEVGLLRGQLATLKTPADRVALLQQPAAQTGHNPGVYVSSKELANVGYATPEAAFETITWAMMNGTYEQVNAGLSPEILAEELRDSKNRQGFEVRQKAMAPIFKGLQIVARKTLSGDRVELKVKQDYDAEAMKKVAPQSPPEYMVQPMTNVGGQWKLGGSTRGHQASWDEGGEIQLFTEAAR